MAAKSGDSRRKAAPRGGAKAAAPARVATGRRTAAKAPTEPGAGGTGAADARTRAAEASAGDVGAGARAAPGRAAAEAIAAAAAAGVAGASRIAAGLGGIAAPAAGDTQRGSPGLAERATLFVREAASVLEKELAAGIGAARALEGRMMDVDRVRGRDPKEVIQRFRRDAHDVVDILIDLVAVGVDAVDGVARRAIRITSGAAGSGAAAGGPGAPEAGVPTLSAEAPARAGSTVTLDMAIENAGEAPRSVTGFQASDLLGSDGGRIPAKAVRFAPSAVEIAANGKARVTIAIDVPADTTPGTYCGMMMAEQMDQLRAMLTVTVARPGDSPD